MSQSSDLFERANLVADIVAISGKKLQKSGRWMRGECPVCNASPKRGAGGAFCCDPDRSIWKCFACKPDGGDAVDLEHRLWGQPGETVRDAAFRLLKEAPPSTDYDQLRAAKRSKQDLQDAADERARRWKANLAVALWRDGLPAKGTIVETYLRQRGAFGPQLELALAMCRFHPAAYHSGPYSNPVTAPGMVNLKMTHMGPTGGVHVTYLNDTGTAKAKLDPAKQCWGPQSRADDHEIMRHGGVWLTRPDAPGPLVVGEGYENTLIAACMLGIPCRAVATMSLQAFQGSYLTDGRGRVNLSALSPHPQFPAFTWPEPEDNPWGPPLLVIDRDMRNIKVRVAGADEEDEVVTLGADDRAAICAVLAGAAWIENGAQWIHLAMPPPDMDITDLRNAAIAGLLPNKLPVTSLIDFAKSAEVVVGVEPLD